MDLKKLEAFIGLAKSSGVAELTFEGKDEKYSVSFISGVRPISHPILTAPDQATAPVAEKSGGKSSSKENGPKDGLLEVVSPFVGTFYRASSPNAPEFVKTGDRIAPGKVLCIIEAMKIMNEIESDISGVIVEVCVENENYVEYGQVLFKVKPV
ncbi:MAG: acetyl-CoA carboxylase biotin carboxyl carrier protein [Pseudomonadota bacterium]